MKKILFAILMFSIVSCSNEAHKHDGKYTGEVELFGMNVIHLVYEINGNDLIINNGITGSQKHQCKQSENSVEFQDEKGIIQVLNILENGDISINDKIILHKIKENKSESVTESNSTIKNEDGSNKYYCTKNNFSDFIVQNSSLERNSKPHLVTYAFKGALKNNTKNIYEKTFVRCELIFVLENGNELNCSEINYGKNLIGSGVFSTVKSNWKPNEEWIIDKIESCHFSTDYFDYPVKEVYTQFYIELEDQVNNTKNEVMISQGDATDRWKIAKKKYQNNNPDCNDNKVSEYLAKK